MTTFSVRWSAAVATLVIVFAGGSALLYQTASAQAPGPAGGQLQPLLPRQPQGPPNRPLGAPQNIAIISDENNLFVVEGNRVFKLNKGDLSVIAQTELRPPQRPAAPKAP